MADANGSMSVCFWDAVKERSTVRRALLVASIVGTLLCLINQWEAIIGGFIGVNWFKVVLTYMVPFSVSTYSTAASKVDFAKKNMQPVEQPSVE
ncbi:nitrate/nitrite transporter NrtS [Kordiimonas sp. SCSIO 12610]|uniref:nitrate/nitrite transporter NrtS n=1 Tax=Kordiimonas sp. SCSIO 12610 TaxID=2829597 RepID=UPI00210B0104|nr:nitrate/nitrite transporter NrtS [Kordiimonas sp. SCSIO 12610]UTW56686.1 nitrate/nitrite transporter NrtS [Kordiimonas sp. SCSIO 12610]